MAGTPTKSLTPNPSVTLDGTESPTTILRKLVAAGITITSASTSAPQTEKTPSPPLSPVNTNTAMVLFEEPEPVAPLPTHTTKPEPSKNLLSPSSSTTQKIEHNPNPGHVPIEIAMAENEEEPLPGLPAREERDSSPIGDAFEATLGRDFNAAPIRAKVEELTKILERNLREELDEAEEEEKKRKGRKKAPTTSTKRKTHSQSVRLTVS